MVFSQGGLSSAKSLVRVVSNQGGISSGCSLVRVLSHESGLSSGIQMNTMPSPSELKCTEESVSWLTL